MDCHGRPGAGLLDRLGIASDLLARLRPAQGGSRVATLPRALIGMWIAHLGVAMFAFGVAMVKTYEASSDVELAVGDSSELAGYRFQLQGLREVRGANYRAVQGRVEVTRGGRVIALLAPEKRRYSDASMLMTEAAIDTRPTRDLFVSLGEALPGGAWILRLQYKPFIGWIWIGCLLMMSGGALAASDRRYRARGTQTVALSPQPVTAGVGR